MKISKVEAFLMSYPMPEPINLPFWGGLRTIVKRDAMLIKVTSDNGLVGHAPGPAHERAAEEINGVIRSFLVDKNPLGWKTFNFLASVELKKTYHAVEIAILDLVAKYEGCTMSELMGGRKRSNIKLYGSAGMYMSPENYADEAAEIQAMGFLGYKMRPALGPKEDIRTLELIRSTTGSEFPLMVDAHTWWRMGDKSYTMEDVRNITSKMKEYNAYWLEEPFPPDDHTDYKDLCDLGLVKIATGEHEQDLAGFEDLARNKAAHFLQMDICCQGGIEMGLNVINLAQANGLKFAFHCWGNQLEVLAAAQLGVCWDESVVEWLEYPCYSAPGQAGMYPFPLSDEILKEKLEIANGYLTVPSSPGLGININPNVLEKYPYIPGPWSYFSQDSPQETIAVTGDHSLKWINE